MVTMHDEIQYDWYENALKRRAEHTVTRRREQKAGDEGNTENSRTVDSFAIDFICNYSRRPTRRPTPQKRRWRSNCK